MLPVTATTVTAVDGCKGKSDAQTFILTVGRQLGNLFVGNSFQTLGQMERRVWYFGTGTRVLFQPSVQFEGCRVPTIGAKAFLTC